MSAYQTYMCSLVRVAAALYYRLVSNMSLHSGLCKPDPLFCLSLSLPRLLRR